MTFMLNNFREAIRACEDKATKAVLSRVCAMFACSNICDDPSWIGLLPAGQMKLVKQATAELLNQLRPDAIALVDAFDIPDKVLNSALGKFDGNVYEALYEAAQRSSLNKRDPFDGYQEYLRPYLDLEFLKKGNRVPGSDSKL